MKVTYIVIFSLSFFATLHALPAKLGESDEVEFVPLEDQNGGRPVITTGVIGGPWFNPFDGLFESFASMMARLRQQMDYLLKGLPVGNRTIENSEFPGFPDIDLSKGNTTSITKVIDGHKVVINETEYKHEGDFGGSFFKVRIIDVQPDSSELTTEKNAEEITTNSKDTESVENSFENEIPKTREIEVSNNIETFGEPDASLPHQKISDRSINWDNIETFDDVEDNSVEFMFPVRDLSRDTYVNDLMADAGAPINPDAEVFSDVEYNFPYATGRRQPFERMMYPR